ncbi:isoprenoid biosynthesis glyoxalase ElbB, partial [Candidatus Anaplasma sp. TIGMIC]|uniref:isoprenoid biosynthesis glyoxalase ElbB n=1 Tax=Candidatus Anaplasma sp. TIGMIC TaxID=3020713 RepID=UPI00232F9165
MRSAVLLSGCGHMDGAEIREAVLALLALDVHGVEVVCCAADAMQRDVVNHITGQEANESRNILHESARIARGDIKSLTDISPEDFDMIVLPGGLGVAKNYSNIMDGEGSVTIANDVQSVLTGFAKKRKPIGAICIAPAIVAASLRSIAKVKVTLGDSANAGIIARCGGEHIECDTDHYVEDTEWGVFSCSAYMRADARLRDISSG